MIVWFSGLIRGAIAFALSLEISSKMEHRSQMVSTVLMVVLMTTIVLGGLMSTFAKLIGLDPESTAVEDDKGVSQHKSVQSSKDNKKKDSKCRQRWRWFDDNYIKRYVGGDTSRSKHLVRNSIASKQSILTSMHTNDQQKPLMDEIKEQQDEYRDSSVIRSEDYKAPNEEPSNQKGINISKEK